MRTVSLRGSRLGIRALLLIGVLTSTVRAVPPNPLESAYWRFEEGSNFTPVNAAIADPVRDSINQNHLDAFAASSAPGYVSSVPPTALKSGLTNTLALDFIRSTVPGESDDLFTLHADGEHGKGLAKNINNGIIAPVGGFTIEAAFNTNTTIDFQGVVSKEGRPGLGKGLGFIENLPTFALKARRFANNPADFRDGRLQVEQWDAAGNIVDVVSIEPINPGQWYYAAVVNDGAMLSLYLDSNNGMGYQLQGSVPISGALFQGDDPENPDWDHSWTVGRAQFGGGPADFFDGFIDEVRITNTALTPSQFLFAPPSQGIDGDYNDNGTVDAADYVLWRKNLNQSVTIANDPTPGMVTQDDYVIWRQNFGMGSAGLGAVAAVPEPASMVLCIVSIGVCGLLVRARKGY